MVVVLVVVVVVGLLVEVELDLSIMNFELSFSTKFCRSKLGSIRSCELKLPNFFVPLDNCFLCLNFFSSFYV